MSKLSVVIPSRNISNLEACIFNIRSAGEDCEIIVVDDGLRCLVNTDIAICTYISNCPKPFVFARNVNLGIKAAQGKDVVVLNDDALLKSPHGFTVLQQAAEESPEFGVISATTNNVGWIDQYPRGIGLRESKKACFIAVLIPQRTIEAVGLLDERFTAYGYDDDDYCYRVRQAGLKVGIHDGCFVDHRSLPSTFRGMPTTPGNLARGSAIFKEIHGIDPRSI